MAITVHDAVDASGTHVLALAGRVDLLDARDLGRRLHDSVRAGRRRVVLDITRTELVADGPFIAAVLGVRAQLRASGGRLVVVATGPRFGRLARVTALDELVEICESLPDGLRRAAA